MGAVDGGTEPTEGAPALRSALGGPSTPCKVPRAEPHRCRAPCPSRHPLGLGRCTHRQWVSMPGFSFFIE